MKKALLFKVRKPLKNKASCLVEYRGFEPLTSTLPEHSAAVLVVMEMLEISTLEAVSLLSGCRENGGFCRGILRNF